MLKSCWAYGSTVLQQPGYPCDRQPFFCVTCHLPPALHFHLSLIIPFILHLSQSDLPTFLLLWHTSETLHNPNFWFMLSIFSSYQKVLLRKAAIVVFCLNEILNFSSLLFTWCTNSLTFNNCKFCPHCICVFCIYLRTNSDLCHLQHKQIGFYNRDEKCLLRGANWAFK